MVMVLCSLRAMADSSTAWCSTGASGAKKLKHQPGKEHFMQTAVHEYQSMSSFPKSTFHSAVGLCMPAHCHDSKFVHNVQTSDIHKITSKQAVDFNIVCNRWKVDQNLDISHFSSQLPW